MHKKNLIRDFFIYTVTSIQKLLFKGHVSTFIKDMQAFWLWRKFRVSTKNTLDFRTPWLSFDTIGFLKNWLNKEMIVFEYGSGGSSLFISDKVKKIYSIEHNEKWFGNVNEVIKSEGVKNIDLRLYLPEVRINDSFVNCDNPINYVSCMGEFKDLNFEKYVKSIDEFPDNHFDLIIVDGRARPSCILHSMEKLKKGGILLVDNTERTYYLKSFPELFNKNKWQQKIFQGHTPFGLTSVLYTTILFTKC